MKKIVLIHSLIAALIFVSYCSPKPEVFQGVVTFISGTLTINNQNALYGSRVQCGDVLITGENSLAVVQISQTAVITLRSNTELKFENMLSKKDAPQILKLFLTKGSTFHKVLIKGTDYSVKTSTIVVSVRGTSFEVNTDGTKHKISLLNGKVHIAKSLEANNQVQNIELNPGQFIESTADVLEQPVILNNDETDKLNQLDSIPAVTDVEKAIPMKDNTGGTGKQNVVTPQVEIITEAVKESILNSEKIDDKNIKPVTPEVKKAEFVPTAKAVKTLIKKQDRTIEDIKVVFKRIDEIHLYSGRVIQGAVSARGSNYSIITTDGVVKIPEKEIQTVKVIR